ncbi:MAG TPA: permease [Burkholderiales bacterium]
MQPTLSFEQAPPISVPYRFFLTAPLFGAVAGLILAWLGPAAFESRWSPGALAMTHLIVVDFMLQAMCGSLLQFVAVVAGANIWRPRLVATLVHPLITAGAVFLATAFLLEQQLLFLAAALVFATALGLFLTVMAIALLRTPARGMPIHVLRLAVLGLLVTVVLGVTLASTLGLQENLQSVWSLLTLINVHVAWGLGGWALMLVIGVSYLVVPMFQLTPAYPVWLTRLVPAGLFLVLCLWSLQLLPGTGEAQPWQSGVILAGMLLAGLYAAATLWLQSRRRRRQADVTLNFWRGAMLALLALAASWLLFGALPQLGGHARAPLWLGVLALPGVFLSVIMGMLYKIMPFLNWLHLQRQGGTVTTQPNMKQMIPERAMRGQMRLHFTALVLLLAAVLWPALALPAGLAFSASCLWLEWNLIGAARVYVRFRDKIRAAVSGGAVRVDHS